MEPNRPSKIERLRALMAEFSAELPLRVKEIRESWEWEVVHGEAPFEAEGPQRRLAHNLAGAAGTFGYRELGEEARILERELMTLGGVPLSQLPPDRLARVSTLLGRLETLAGLPPRSGHLEAKEPALPSLQTTSPVPLLYVLEDDALLAQELAIQLESFGYRVRGFGTPAELARALPSEPPTALLADIAFPEGAFESIPVVGELRAAGLGNVPVIFFSIHDEWEAHLAALRAGGKAYFPKPLDYTALLEQIDRLTGRRG